MYVRPYEIHCPPKTRPSGQRCVLMTLKRHKKASWAHALKGNDRIGLMKVFLAFFTKALHTDGRTNRRTDGRTDRWRMDRQTHPLIEMRGLHWFCDYRWMLINRQTDRTSYFEWSAVLANILAMCGLLWRSFDISGFDCSSVRRSANLSAKTRRDTSKIFLVIAEKFADQRTVKPAYMDKIGHTRTR